MLLPVSAGTRVDLFYNLLNNPQLKIRPRLSKNGTSLHKGLQGLLQPPLIQIDIADAAKGDGLA